MPWVFAPFVRFPAELKRALKRYKNQGMQFKNEIQMMKFFAPNFAGFVRTMTFNFKIGSAPVVALLDGAVPPMLDPQGGLRFFSHFNIFYLPKTK
jgi:hypothetical protein